MHTSFNARFVHGSFVHALVWGGAFWQAGNQAWYCHVADPISTGMAQREVKRNIA